MADTAAEALTKEAGLLDWLTGGSTTSSVALLFCILFGAYAAYIITNEPTRDGTHAPVNDEDDETEPPRDFTPQQLKEFNGKDEDTPLYVCVKGDVFDVSEARSFYGPGGGYALFAGRDASKCLATMSLEESDLDQPIADLNHGEREHLDEWHFKFKEMKGYAILGRLAQPDPTKYISRAELLERGTGTCTPIKGRCCAEHLIGVRGNVYDVGFGGVGFYGAGCSYHLFCGRDASRALAKMSFKPEDVDRGWPDLGDLDEKEVKILDDWEKLFARKYPVVARLREAEE